MEENNCTQDSKLDYNKEGKYQKEIFRLLENVIDSNDDSDIELFKKLFTESLIENNELVNLIKKLK